MGKIITLQHECLSKQEERNIYSLEEDINSSNGYEALLNEKYLFSP